MAEKTHFLSFVFFITLYFLRWFSHCFRIKYITKIISVYWTQLNGRIFGLNRVPLNRAANKILSFICWHLLGLVNHLVHWSTQTRLPLCFLSYYSLGHFSHSLIILFQTLRIDRTNIWRERKKHTKKSFRRIIESSKLNFSVSADVVCLWELFIACIVCRMQEYVNFYFAFNIMAFNWNASKLSNT